MFLPSLTLYLTSALICIDDACYNALVGIDTPIGTYKLELLHTSSPGYGGSVLGFHSDDSGVYAIHQTWLGNPNERREERLSGKGSRIITNGCINVEPELYDWLAKNCSECILEVVP